MNLGRCSSPTVITANTSLDEAHIIIKAFHPILRIMNDAKAILQSKGWTPPNREIMLELLTKILFATAMTANKLDTAMTNIILATGYLITEQIRSLTKANIISRVTKQLLDTLVPITSNFKSKLEEHLHAIANSTTLHTELSEKLQQTQAKLWCWSLSDHHFMTVARLGWWLVLGAKSLFHCVSSATPGGTYL